MVYFCHECNRRVSVNASLQCENCHGEFVEEISNEEEFFGTAGAAAADHVNASDDDEMTAAEGGSGGGGRRGMFVIQRDGDGEGGSGTIIFEGVNPLLEMMSRNSPFSGLFQSLLNPRSYARPTSSDPAVDRLSSTRGSTDGRSTTGQTSQQSSGGLPFGATSGEDNLMHFFNQLMSNLAESPGGGVGGSEGGGGPTRLMFHIDGSTGGFRGLHGNFNDYAWGEGGLDNIVTQLLNQFEGSGATQNVSAQDLARLPMTEVTDKQVENGMQCATCMETFTLRERVARLDCQHIFHRPCIEPWLKKRNTCPICRQVVDPSSWGPEPKITDVDELD